MKVTKAETEESTKHCCVSGCSRRGRAEHGEEGGALIGKRITENNVTNDEADRKKLLERIVSPENLNNAYKRVMRNKGAGGVDGMSVHELQSYLKDKGEEIRQSILAGKYKPAPVRRVEIPKENGKKRKLGIPTAADRVIQQAIAQVLSPIYEKEFVETSYGFRPGKSAQEAIQKCQEYQNEGYEWVVDMDLEKFFDTVNQSKLIEILSRKIKDGRVISLIHKYLRAGAVWCGTYEETRMGVPQGGPLSPLCANIMLNELDHELEKRGHYFVRYADDMVIFCRSKASAKQTLEHIIPYIEKKLFLKVNQGKTMAGESRRMKFLGYGFYKSRGKYYPCVHEKSKRKMKGKVKELTGRRQVSNYEGWKRKLKQFIVGWVNYYKLANMGTWLKDIDGWMRRRIRMVFWNRWKKVETRYRNLKKLGIDQENARKLSSTRKGDWRVATSPILKAALSNERLERDGFQCFYSYYTSVKS